MTAVDSIPRGLRPIFSQTSITTDGGGIGFGVENPFDCDLEATQLRVDTLLKRAYKKILEVKLIPGYDETTYSISSLFTVGKRCSSVTLFMIFGSYTDWSE